MPGSISANSISTDVLIVGALPLVKKIAAAAASKYRSFEFDDLVSIGSIGMVDAARRWKPAKRYPSEEVMRAHFWLYVKPRVVGAMLDEIRACRLYPEVLYGDVASAADQAEKHDLSDLIELFETVYNRFGRENAELVRDLTFSGRTKKAVAKEKGMSVFQLNSRLKRLADRLKKSFPFLRRENDV